MQAATDHGTGDIRVEERPDPEIEEPTGAVVRSTHTAICGSDLWFYRDEEELDEGVPVGHESMGIVATRDEERDVSEVDLIVFSPTEEQWHGNKPDAESPFSHISLIAQPEGAEPTVLD